MLKPNQSTTQVKQTGAIQVDAQNLLCPQPILLLRNAMRTNPAQDEFALTATDPMASIDVRAFCLRGGHSLEREENVEGVLRFVVRRAVE